MGAAPNPVGAAVTFVEGGAVGPKPRFSRFPLTPVLPAGAIGEAGCWAARFVAHSGQLSCGLLIAALPVEVCPAGVGAPVVPPIRGVLPSVGTKNYPACRAAPYRAPRPPWPSVDWRPAKSGPLDWDPRA